MLFQVSNCAETHTYAHIQLLQITQKTTAKPTRLWELYRFH